MRSNCLIIALKNHIKYGHTIYYVKPLKFSICPHFVWWDNGMYSYMHYTKKGILHWWEMLWFMGHIDNFPYERLKIKLIRIL